MKLYTLIGLALSLFGGTYASLAALRAHLEDFFKIEQGVAKEYIEKIREHYKSDLTCKSVKDAENNILEIKNAFDLWKRCNRIPVICFLPFVLVLAIVVVIFWDAVCQQADSPPTDYTQFPWLLFRFALGIMVAADIGTLIGVWRAWSYCVKNGKELKQAHTHVIDEEKITPIKNGTPGS